ncbi:hypothetical protein Tco_0241578 [Tanacetum coccineum]
MFQRTLRTSSSGNTSIVYCYNYSGKGHYTRNYPKPRVRESKYFMEQMLLAKQDEARVILTDEHNDFLFTIGDDQIDSDIIFDSPNGNVNSGSIEKDTHVPNLMNVASSVRRPMNKDSHVKNSVLANSKKPAKKVAVYVRKNKQTDNTSEILSQRKRITLSTKTRTPYDTTYVVHKTRFFKELTLSKSLDTTYVVSKPKIDVESTLKANDKLVQIVLWIVDNGCSKHMMGDRSLLKNFIEKFMGTVRFGNDQSQAMVIIYKAISLFVMYIMLKVLDIISSKRCTFCDGI